MPFFNQPDKPTPRTVGRGGMVLGNTGADPRGNMNPTISNMMITGTNLQPNTPGGFFNDAGMINQQNQGGLLNFNTAAPVMNTPSQLLNFGNIPQGATLPSMGSMSNAVANYRAYMAQQEAMNK